MKTIADRISHLSPCTEAVTWLGDQTDVADAWNSCPRGDWLLWLAGRVGVERTVLVKSAAGCARLVLHLVPAGEDRPRLAIAAAEAWATEPNENNRNKAAEAAWAAWTAADFNLFAIAEWAVTDQPIEALYPAEVKP